MGSHFYLGRVGQTAEGGEDGNLQADPPQFLPREGREAGVFGGGGDGHLLHGPVEGSVGPEVADASPQLPVLPESDECPRRPQQVGVFGFVGRDGAVGQVGFQRPAGQPQQCFPPRGRQVGRGVAPEHHRAVAYYLLGVAGGGIGGVRIAEDGDGIRPQPGSDAHRHPNRPLPTGAGDQSGDAPLHRRRDRLPHPVGVSGLYRGQGGPVHCPGVLLGRIMGQVGGGDDDGLPAQQRAQQRVRQDLDRGLIVGAHQHGDDAALRADPLKKREFYLYRVFPLVGVGVKGDTGIGLDEGVGQVGIHRHQAQRGLPRPLRPDGDGPGEGGLMVGGDDDGDVVLPVAQLAEARRRHRPGEDVSGMGNDEGQRRAVHRSLRFQHPVYGPRQFVRIGGIPGAGDGRGTDAAEGREGSGRCRSRRLRRRGGGGTGSQEYHQCQQAVRSRQPIHRQPRPMVSHKDTKARDFSHTKTQRHEIFLTQRHKGTKILYFFFVFSVSLCENHSVLCVFV